MLPAWQRLGVRLMLLVLEQNTAWEGRDHRMARKKDNLIELLADLPWWISVVIAGVVYAGMRWILPSMEFGNPMLKGLAAAMPKAAWFFGILFLIPALVSFIRSMQRKRLLDSRSDIDSIRDLSWADFELLIGEAFRREGYSVEERGGGGADGGIDLVLRKSGEKILVQCKQWKSRQVGVSVVRELYGVMVHEKAARAIVAISGEYTEEAKSFARGKPLELLNGPALFRLVSKVKVGPVLKVSEPVLTQKEKDSHPTRKETSFNSGPCPECGSEMVRRVAKRGVNAGTPFWGCSMYPKCRGTRPV